MAVPESPTIIGPVTFFLLMFSPSSARYVLTLLIESSHIVAAILVVEKDRAFQQVFVIRIDLGADVAVGVGPFAGLDVDVRPDQTDRRTAFVCLDQRTLCLFVIDRLSGKFAQRAELDQQRAGLGRIRDLASRLSGFEIYKPVRQPGRRIEYRQQPRAKIVRQIQQPFVTGDLIARKQPAEYSDRYLKILDVDVFVERKVLCDVFPRLVRLFLETQADKANRANRPASSRSASHTNRGRSC